MFAISVPCFEVPPTWWTPLANLTGWFDWDAIGAVSTAGALYLTIRLATEARRERRHREAVLLAAAAHILKPALLSIGSALKASETADQWNSVGRPYIFNRLREDRIDERLIEIRPFDLPTISTADSYQSALVALANVRDEEAVPGSNWRQIVVDSFNDIEISIVNIESESDKRSLNFVQMIVKTILKNIRQ